MTNNLLNTISNIPSDQRLASGIELELWHADGRSSVGMFSNLLEQNGFLGIECKSDGSENVSLEIAFPPMDYDSYFAQKLYKDVTDLAESNGFKVKKGNGIHVHVSCKYIKESISSESFSRSSYEHAESCLEKVDNGYVISRTYKRNLTESQKYYSDGFSDEQITFEQIKDVSFRYSKHQLLINRFFPKSRHKNSFCASFTNLETIIESCQNIDDLKLKIKAYLRANFRSDGIGDYGSMYRGSKFQAINYTPYPNTIEYRQASTSLSLDRLVAWVRLINTMHFHTSKNRLEYGNEEIITLDVPSSISNILRRGTKQEMIYNLLLQRQNTSPCGRGILGSDICRIVNISKQSLRRQLSELRKSLKNASIINDNGSSIIVTHGFIENGFSSGDGDVNCSYDLVSYMTKKQTSDIQLMSSERIGTDSIYGSLDDTTYQFINTEMNRLNPN